MANNEKTTGQKRKIKTCILFSILGAVLILGLISCSSPPPIRPALSQTVINVQRSATRQDRGDLFIYVNDQEINAKAPIKPGQFYTFPVNNGVHYIHGVIRGAGPALVSEAINFTANSTTVSFIATVERDGIRSRLVINRTDVIDDTGRQTNLAMQEAYGNQ